MHSKIKPKSRNITKTCSKCKQRKAISEFSKWYLGKDGLRGQCKECISVQSKKYFLLNKQKILSQNKKWADQNKEHSSIYQKEYHEKHRDARLKRNKERYADNKDRIQAKNKEWLDNNKERFKEYQKKYGKTEIGKRVFQKAKHKRRAVKYGVGYELFSAIEIFERDNYICQRCRCKTRPDFKSPYHPNRPQLDHIVPLSRGGCHSKINTQCLCRQCNMEKGSNGTGDQLRMFG